MEKNNNGDEKWRETNGFEIINFLFVLNSKSKGKTCEVRREKTETRECICSRIMEEFNPEILKKIQTNKRNEMKTK